MRGLLKILQLSLLGTNSGFLSVVIRINCWSFIGWLICLGMAILNSNRVSILLFRDFKPSICIFIKEKSKEEDY